MKVSSQRLLSLKQETLESDDQNHEKSTSMKRSVSFRDAPSSPDLKINSCAEKRLNQSDFRHRKDEAKICPGTYPELASTIRVNDETVQMSDASQPLDQTLIQLV